MKTKLFTILVAASLLTVCPVKAVVVFNDGGEHTIDYVIDDSVVVDYDTPGAGTLVELISGGWIKSSLEVYEDGRVTVWDGEVEGVQTWAGSEVKIYGGTMDSIVAHIYGVVEMYGGEVIRDFKASDNAKAVVSGGTIGMGIEVAWRSEITVSGGEISGGFYLRDSGLIILEGSGFEINGQSVKYGDFASDYATPDTDPWGYPCLTGTVTGTLANDYMLNNPFVIYDEADITFVPEPATILLLGIGILGVRAG